MAKNFMDYDNAEDVLTRYANEIKGNQNKTLSAPIVVKGQNCNTVESALNAIADAINGDIPNGRTVIPTDDIPTWLACGARSEEYTTLSQVLSDATCLAGLMVDNNAVDYLVRSTAWASEITGNALAMHDVGINNYCANTLKADSTWLSAIGSSSYIDNVLNTKAPIMTSNNVPSGNCFAKQSAYNNYDPWMAFDGTAGKYYQESTNVAIGDTLGYEFSSPVAIQKVYCLSNNAFKEYKVQGSNDGITWTDVKTGIDHTTHESSAVFSNTTAYEYWQISVTQVDTAGSKMAILKLQFWGREDVPSTITKKTFATATDAEINEMVKWASRGVIDLEDDCGWAVGQTHTTTLGAIASTGTYNGITWTVGESQDQQSVTYVLSRKGVDELVSPQLKTDGTQRTVVNFRANQVDCLNTKGYMNSTNTNTGSWGASARRGWGNSGFLQALPSAIRTAIALVKTITAKTYNETENEITNDYVILDAEKEIQGARTFSNQTEADALTQVTFYETSANKIKKVNGSVSAYFLRSPVSTGATGFCNVETNGSANGTNASNPKGIAPVIFF